MLTLTVLASARYIQGVRVKSVPAAVGRGGGVQSAQLAAGRLLKVLLFLPAILTLGLLFLVMPLIVNVILLWLTDKVLHVFEIEDAKAPVADGHLDHRGQRRAAPAGAVAALTGGSAHTGRSAHTDVSM